MPLFLFGWLPILYFAGILSVPESFRRRFGPRTGVAATAVLLLYLVGYIGINLFTIGRALETLFGIDAFVLLKRPSFFIFMLFSLTPVVPRAYLCYR